GSTPTSCSAPSRRRSPCTTEISCSRARPSSPRSTTPTCASRSPPACRTCSCRSCPAFPAAPSCVPKRSPRRCPERVEPRRVPKKALDNFHVVPYDADVSARVTVAVDDDGRVLACKRAGTAAEGARLRHEAALLARLRRPGIVDLVRVDGSDADEGVGADDHGHALYTAFVGTRSLDTAAPLPVEHAAELVARLAMVVADLHERGIVHGRIDPSHVLVGTDGAPVLCGFSGAGARGSAIPDGPPAAPGFRDPCALVGGELTDSIDVYGLGALLRDLVIGDGPDPEPIPERRFRRRRDARWTGYLRRALLTLADQATDDQPSRRPTARRLAHDIRSLLHPATERDEPVPAPVADDDPFAALRPRDDTGEPPRRRRLGLVALADRGPNGARTATLGPRAAGPSSTTASATTSTTTSHSTTVVGNS